MSESFENLLLDVCESLSNFSEVYLSSLLDRFHDSDCSDCSNFSGFKSISLSNALNTISLLLLLLG